MTTFLRRLGALAGTLVVAATLLGAPLAQAATGTPHLILTLKDGDVDILLMPEIAPKHVERIIALTDKGFYNGLKFHRVIDGFMAQTGDPTGTGAGGSDLPDVVAEFSPTHFGPGIVGAARSQEPNSFNSQFFITFADAGFLDGQYTVFGKVVAGMDHVNSIKKGDPNSGEMSNPDVIVSAKIVYE
ncbi:MAG: peptidylprolyl isomerase [Devosia sp.]